MLPDSRSSSPFITELLISESAPIAILDSIERKLRAIERKTKVKFSVEKFLVKFVSNSIESEISSLLYRNYYFPFEFFISRNFVVKVLTS